MPTILFPNSPIQRHNVDESFIYEFAAAKKAGFNTGLVDVELYFGGEVSFSNLDHEPSDHAALYRGWLVKPEQYASLTPACRKRSLGLCVDTESYDECYNFPKWYAKLNKYTSKSLIVPWEDNLDFVANLVAESFENGSLILKDYIKSRKHDWFEACFIRDCQDVEDIKRVVSNFVKLQGDNLVGGLVFREFRKFEAFGIHPKSNLPIINEHRVFLWNKKVFYTCPYWESDKYKVKYDFEWVEDQVKDILSPFISVDVALLDTGDFMAGAWEIVEIGDGGTSGIPELGNKEDFYNNLKEAMN